MKQEYRVPDRKRQRSMFVRKPRDCARTARIRPAKSLAVGMLALFGFLASACDRGDHPARIGYSAPQFTVSDGAQSVSLEQLRGHIVILNFWATWCIPCIEEVPSLVELHHRMPQLAVLAISQDEDAGLYSKFLTDNHVDFQTVRDPSARIPKLYGTIKIPETYVIDRNGVLRRKFVSAQNWTNPEIMDYLSKL
jgi:cytochrome c biogenesis protein CcmG, thiol:disulfide interchange protein DsbE